MLKIGSLGKLVDSAFLLAIATGLLYLAGYAFYASAFAFRGLPVGEILLEPVEYVHQGFLVLVVLGLIAFVFLAFQPPGGGRLRGVAALAIGLLAYHFGYLLLSLRHHGALWLAIRDLAPPLVGLVFLFHLRRLKRHNRDFLAELSTAENPRQAAVGAILAVSVVLSVATATAGYTAVFSEHRGVVFASDACDPLLDGKVFRFLVHAGEKYYVKDRVGNVLVVEEREGLTPRLLTPDEKARERAEEERRLGMTPEEMAADRSARGSPCAPGPTEE